MIMNENCFPRSRTCRWCPTCWV